MVLNSLKIVEPYLQWLGVVSFLTFILSILMVPWVIGRLPDDFFLHTQKQQPQPHLKPGKIILLIIRNLLGILLLAAGILMLFIPGQGILTMLIGLLCMSFPGKQDLIKYFIKKKKLQNSLDWTRKKISRPPFLWQ